MEGLKIMMSLNLLIRLPFMKSQCIVVLENVSSHERGIEINNIQMNYSILSFDGHLLWLVVESETNRNIPTKVHFGLRIIFIYELKFM